MKELWQLYNNIGTPINTKGATDDEILSKGLLHAAAHVWVWRENNGKKELLLQKRSQNKRTWPNLLDISAAGHIDLGESPQDAAKREAHEELGIIIKSEDLFMFGVYRCSMMAQDGASKENEFCWLYTYKMVDGSTIKLADGEVSSVVWKNIEEIKNGYSNTDLYVPHGSTYFSLVFEAIEGQSDEVI